jgi:membrane fusion protein (multidrug efflux system)
MTSSWVAKHRLATAALILLALAAVAAGVVWWLQSRHYENTDDAFIDARPSAISAQVAAAITDVLVTDNQVVQSGEILARLDDRDFRAAQAQAQAQIAQAQAASCFGRGAGERATRDH